MYKYTVDKIKIYMEFKYSVPFYVCDICNATSLFENIGVVSYGYSCVVGYGYSSRCFYISMDMLWALLEALLPY